MTGQMIEGGNTDWFVRKLVRKAIDNAIAKQFAPTTWELVPGRLMMAITELEEIVTADHGHGAELADLTIRLASILEALYPHTWRLHAYPGRYHDPSTFGSIEREVWLVIRHASRAVKAWSRGFSIEVEAELERSVSYCFRLADLLRVNLPLEMESKINADAEREPRHGAVESL